MKCLKIEDNKGLYSTDGKTWNPIDKLNKNDLLTLLDIAVSSEFEMDEYDIEKLAHQAHQIIYKHIHEKFKEILHNKCRFTDESERMYKKAIEKYSSKPITNG